MFYRYEIDGMGLYEYLRLHCGSKKKWIEIKRKSGNWLKSPNIYKSSYRSYFTELGNDKFDKTLKKLADDCIIKERLNNVVYADDYQVIIDIGLKNLQKK